MSEEKLSNISPNEAQAIKTVQTVLSVDNIPVQSTLSGCNTQILVDHEVDKDDAAIMALGYKPEFKRELSFFSTFAVSFSVLGLLPSIAATVSYSLGYAGNAGMTWAWLLASIGVVCVASSMAEISSAFPTAGGLYYATAMLSPPKYKALLSWIVGWSNYLARLVSAPSIAYSTSMMILTLADIGGPGFTIQNYQVFLLATLIMIICSVMASLPTIWIARLNEYSTYLNIVTLVIAFVMLLAGNQRKSLGLSKFNSNGVAWAITNETEWPDGVAVIMSFLACIWCICGFDSPFHLAEECANAQMATPRAIVSTAVCGAIFGFIFQLAIVYTVVDIDDILTSSSGQPFIAFLYQALPEKSAMALGALTCVVSVTCTFACMIETSRVLFSYSRDRCFPFYKLWSKVNSTTRTPVNAVWANWFLGTCSLLLIFGGAVTLNAIFSMCAIGSYVSFTIPSVLRMTYARKAFKPGPWSLGKLSIPLAVVSASFVLMMIPFFNFPAYKGKDLTPELMNWTVLTYWGSMFLAVAWFFLYAHKFYDGPRPNLDAGSVISGNEYSEQVIEAISSANPNVKYGPDDDEPKV